MRVHLHPQRRTVEVTGRRSVGRLLAELGVLPSTAMVIRRDELLTDGEMVEDDDEIEIRAVISGGSTDEGRAPARRPSVEREDARESGARTRIGARPRSGRAHGRSPRVRASEPASNCLRLETPADGCAC